MTTTLITAAPKLSKLIPLLASDKPGEVVATAAAITRTLKQIGADWHDLTAVLTRAKPSDASPQLAWRDIPDSEQAGWLARMSTSRLLSAWEQDFCASILAQVRFRPRSALSPKQVVILDRLVRKVAEARR